MKHYNLVVCGATLDHFHKGHEGYLRFALSKAQRMLLGLTSDAFAQTKPLNQTIEPYEERKAALLTFLEKENVTDRVTIEPIDDAFIPKAWDSLPIEAIVVSVETRKGADSVNEHRLAHGQKSLEVITCAMELADDGKPMSSFRIRNGEINRRGKLFVRPEWLRTPLLLPKTLRGELKRPLGQLVTDFNLLVREFFLGKNLFEATVGDVVTKAANECFLGQQLSVVDLHVGRKQTFTSISELGFEGKPSFTTQNQAGTLTPSLFRVLEKSIKKVRVGEHVVVQVEGEEDLAVLPLVLHAPLSTLVLYGQPGEGVVVVEVTEEAKERIFAIVSQFSTV